MAETLTGTSNYAQRLRTVQEQTREIAARRDALNREAGGVEHRVEEAYAKLHELGIVKSPTERLTEVELSARLEASQEELADKLANHEALIERANKTFAEFDRPVAA